MPLGYSPPGPLPGQRRFACSCIGRVAVWLGCLATAAACRGVTPESPAVQAAVARGSKFLEDKVDPRLGAYALIGRIRLLEQRREHPQVVAAVAMIRQTTAGEVNPVLVDIYSVGLAIVFLLELDPAVHRAEIESLLAHLLQVQKPHGGWGYHDKPTGDTSMTQYAILALWNAEEAGFAVPRQTWVRAANWLLRTQDSSGAWGYQGNDPGAKDDGSFSPVAQTDTSPTMCAAGLGSLYLCADRLRMVRMRSPDDTELPPAFKKLDAASEADPAAVDAVSPTALSKGLDRANARLREHGRDLPARWHCYFFYTLERMHSFREATLPTPSSREPGWYNDGVDYILKNQRADGSWTGDEQDVPATSFAILFLVRSTRKTLVQARGLGAGTLVGGRGLPATESDVQMRLGRVVAKPLAGPAEQLLSALDDPRGPDYLRAVEGIEELAERASLPELDTHARRLQQLAGTDEPTARAAALRLLARRRNLDDVPLFLEALADADAVVSGAARDGLCFVARRFQVKPPAAELSAAERTLEQRQWRAWYRSLRPGSDE